MPVSYDFEGDILVLRLVGEYGTGEIRAALVAALAEHGSEVSGLLADIRTSDSIHERTLGELTSIMGFLAYYAASYGNRVAILAATEEASERVRFGAVDLAASGTLTGIFRSLDEARTWLQT
jgi:hypothetical protein